MRSLLLPGFLLSLCILAGVGCTTTSPQSGSPSAAASALANRDNPRHQILYLLEHRLLPSLWFEYTGEVTEQFRTRGDEYLHEILVWAQQEAGQSIPGETPMSVEHIDLPEEAEAWLITFPKPESSPLCNYAAMVYDGQALRYFTNEYSLFDHEVWFLCEWTSDGGAHLNYGNTEDGSRETFIARLSQLLAADASKTGAEPVRTEIPRR